MDRVVQNSTLQYQEVHKVHIGEEVKRYKMAPGGTEVPESCQKIVKWTEGYESVPYSTKKYTSFTKVKR